MLKPPRTQSGMAFIFNANSLCFIFQNKHSEKNQPLPACLLNSGDQACAGHLTELNTGDAELAHIPLGTAGKFATVVQTYLAGVARKLLQLGECLVIDVAIGIGQSRLLQGCLLGCVLGYHALALYLAGLH